MQEKLMTNYDYVVTFSPTGGTIVVRRHSDNAFKSFFQATLKTQEQATAVCGFMNSVTDELAEGYWPRPRKEKGKKE
jgi:hypothetical protein